MPLHNHQYCNTIASKQFTHLDIASTIFSLLQRFIVFLYTKSIDVEFVDEARMELLCHDNKTMCMENIPPINSWCPVVAHDARQAAYQASVWATSKKCTAEKSYTRFLKLDLAWMQQEMDVCLDDTCTTNSQGDGLMNIILSCSGLAITMIALCNTCRTTRDGWV